MTVDMSQFYQTFFEESFEGLDRMEAELLNLDVGTADSETINTIFRAAHSIKGGAGTFGFDALASFTHILETLLDEMRSGDREVTQESVDVLLQSVDVLRDMLSGAQDGTAVNQETVNQVRSALEAILNNESAPASAPPATIVSEAISTEPVNETGLDVETLEMSFQALAPRGAELVKRFYNTLFTNYPEVKPLFSKTTQAEQEKKLLAALQLVVSSLRAPGSLVANLSALGAKHQNYGAQPAHYEAVGGVLLQVLAEMTGDNWTEKVATAWKNAITTVARTMLGSYSSVACDKVIGWKISFAPNEHLLRTGNDPVRILRELSTLGDVEIEVNDERMPLFQDLDPEVCYFSWNITLKAEVEESAVREVFEWVEDECDLSLVAITEPGVSSGPVNTEINIAAPAAVAAKSSAPAAPAPSAAPALAPAPTPAPVTQPAKAQVAKQAPQEMSTKKVGGEQGSIRVSTDKIDALINMVGELVITQAMLGQLGEDVDMSRLDKLRDGLSQLERNTRELQESVMRIRMLPISFAFQRFPRMVRDLAQKLQKNVELKLSGEQTELDKTVMEKIGDPLVHLVRNSIDHGIELPAQRIAAGKSAVGTVHLDAYHQGGNIVIEISDDGAGLNRERIIKKAVENGIIGSDETLSDEKIFDLIFEPGFSTAQVVSDVSGRGVGMDVVKKNIRALNGTIEIKSVEGQGSTITIRLPLTLAILDGQLVRVGNDTYIIPLVSIVESLQAYPDKINAIAGQAELYKLREDYIPITRLYELFNLMPDNTDLTKGLLVVVEGEGERVALFVDDLLGQQQVVIKSLETNFRRVDGVSGATILGDGTVALILDVTGVIKLSRRAGTPRRTRKQNQSTGNAGDSAGKNGNSNKSEIQSGKPDQKRDKAA
ncbi:MAG: chemotaxis protein CheW [Gammaproteobacteria bacterium]|nr:chemotaxis protein CheW [Gammaproteobacteria bacterium]